MEKDPATSVPRTEPESFSGTQSSSQSTVKVPSEHKAAETGSFRGPRDKTRKSVIGSSDTTEINSPVKRKLCSKPSVSVGNIAADISHDLQNIQLNTPRRHASTKDMVETIYQNPRTVECVTPSIRPKISGSFRGPRDKTQKSVICSSDIIEITSPINRKLRSKSSVSVSNIAADISHDLQNIQLNTPRRPASSTEDMVKTIYQNPSAADPSLRPKISESFRGPHDKTQKTVIGSSNAIEITNPIDRKLRSKSSVSVAQSKNPSMRPKILGSFRGPRDKTEKSMIGSSDNFEITSPINRQLGSKCSVSVSNIAADISHDLQNIQLNTPRRHASTTGDMVKTIYQNPSATECETPTMRPKISEPQNKIFGSWRKTSDIRSSTPSVTRNTHSPSSSDSGKLKLGIRQMKTRSSVTGFTRVLEKSSISSVFQGTVAQAQASVSGFTCASRKMNLRPNLSDQKGRIHSSSSSSSSSYKPSPNEGGNKRDDGKEGKRLKTSISIRSASHSPSENEYIPAGIHTSSVTHFSRPVQMSSDKFTSDGKRTICSVTDAIEMSDKLSNGKKVKGSFVDRTKTSVSGPVQMLTDVDIHDCDGMKKSVSKSSGIFQIPTVRHVPDAHVTESSVATPDSHLKISVGVHKSDTIRTNLLVTSHDDSIQTMDDPIQTVDDANGTRSSISSFTSSTNGQVPAAIDEYLPEIDKSKNLVSLSNVPIQTHIVTPTKLDRSTKSQERSDFQQRAKASTIIEAVGDAGNKSQSSISINKCPSPANENAARSVKSSADATVRRRVEDDDDDDDNFLHKPPSKRKVLSESKNKPTESEQDHDVEESSLFHLMGSKTLSVQTIVADWVESYKENRHKALLVLLQFVLDAAGCKGKITSDMLQPLDGEQLVEFMSYKLDKDTVEKIGHQFMRSDRKWKTFCLHLELFIQLLVKLCQNSIIYDQFLLDNLTNLLLAMTTSAVRVFRYIATFIAVKLMTALLDLNGIVRTNISHTLRQIDVARSSVRRNSERLEVLMDKEQELQENLDELEQVFSFYYKEVFKERYRDVIPPIRSMCIVELGEWMKKVPEKFVHDAHLRYVGWLLQDPMGDVRLNCMQVLHAVYKAHTSKERLLTFTCRFKGRFLLMTLDKRIDVSILAVEIFGFIYKFFSEFREKKDLQHMYELMFSKHRTIAHAAGIFISNTISQLSSQLSEKSTHGKPWLPNTLFLYKVVKIFVESKMQKYEAYLVDSLIETNEALRDWESMTDLLLEEPDNENDALSDLEENCLIKILLFCIQQSVSKVGPPGREFSVKMLSKKERKQMHDDKISITEHFIEKLPMLLSKYETDAENLQRLLSIPQYLELDMYTTPRKDQYLDKLLEKLRTITDSHHSKEVLESCIKTLELLCNSSSSTSLRGTVACNRIIDTIFAKYKDALKEFQSSIDADELPSEDQVFTMIHCARKVAIFYDHFDLSGWHVWDNFFPLIQEVREDNTSIPEEMIQHCIRACYLSLIWDLREVERTEKHDDLIIMDKVEALRSRREMLISNLKKLLGMSRKNCKEEAFITLCDMLIIFKEGGVLGLNSNLVPLEYSPSRDLQLELLHIVEDLVFSEENKEVESVIQCNILACFIKLFLYNVIPLKAAANILVHYNKPSSNCGKLIKEALDKLLVKNRRNCSYVVLLALKIAFMNLQSLEEGISRNKQGYSNLLELAINLTKVFEEDLIKNREAVVSFHIEGIAFAFEPLHECDEIPQIPPDSLIFLDILTELTHMLHPQDGRSIAKYFDQQVASLHLPNRGRDWPLQAYRNALLHLKVKKPIHPPAAEKGRHKNVTESGSEEEREERRQEEQIITNEIDRKLRPGSSKMTLSSRRSDSSVRKRRLPVKVTRHPTGQLRHQRSVPESPVLTISDIPEISGTLIHPSSTPYVQH